MTLFAVILLGAGLLLIISAHENTSIVATFQGIMSGQPITGAPAGSAGTAGGTGVNTPVSGVQVNG